MTAHTSVETISVQSTPSIPHHVRIPVEDVVLTGELTVPVTAAGVIICLGPRNECAAQTIRDEENATLRIDLLTHQEKNEDAQTHGLRFNIPLLKRRLVAVTRWLAQQPATARFGFGYFGEDMTGAAALAAAAELGVVVDAVVCRHARPDFAANALPRVEAATLLICSTSDEPLLKINRLALDRLHCEKQLQLIRPPRVNAAPDCVGCTLAARWFKSYVRPR